MIELLLSFSKERHTLTARELAAATGIPLPSVYRYVALLRDSGLLAGNGGGYRLTARVSGLAQAAEAAEPLINTADPLMRQLAAESRETILLVRIVAGAAVCVHRIESSQRLRISYELGQPMSLERGASGRILLASLPEKDVRTRLEDLAERDPEWSRRLEREVRLTRKRGWATSQEEIDRGIWAAAAAVYDRGEIAAALSMPSPIARVPAAMRQERLSQVRAVAAELSQRLDVARR